jgi:NAD(P)-dependent dehydrogenase (short-subunit alcohol dehydrogenase family)
MEHVGSLALLGYMVRARCVRYVVMFTSQTMQHRAVLTHLFAGHFYLTKLLLPALKAAEKSSPAGVVRVVNMSSIAHYLSPEGIRWNTLGPGADAAEARKKLGVSKLYAQSKLVKWHNPHVTG